MHFHLTTIPTLPLFPSLSFAMDIEQKTQEKTGSTHVCDWVKALPCKIKAKALGIAKKTKKVGKDDPRRIIHSLKVGFALTLVSLFYYVRPLYNGFGSLGMWAVFTVVVVFEFSVGKSLYHSNGLYMLSCLEFEKPYGNILL